MELRRGFKSEAEATARKLREELRLGVAARLDPWKLAAYLGIPVLRLSDFHDELPSEVRQITRRDPHAFSAVTICRGSRRLVIVNDAHHPNRQASSLAHELAHILLWHEPAHAFGADSVREWNPEQEAEAQWLGGVLLIPDDAALHIAARRLSLEDAGGEYGVSEDMVRFRLQVTAAKKRVARAAGYRRKFAS